MNNYQKILLKITVMIFIMIVLVSCTAKVNRTPSAVVNIYPAQSELVDQNYFYGKWTRSIDPEGERIKYRINFAQSIEALDDPFFYETEETYFLLPNLAPGVWYWRVTAFDAAGNSAQSPVWNFTVNGTSLPQPVNIGELPADPSLLVSNVANTSFTLEWPEYEDVQDPLNEVYYTIYVYEDQNGSYERGAVPFMELREKYPKGTSQTTGTTHTFNGLHSNTGYNWTIVAQCDASRTSIVGSSQIRTGNRAPTTPELLSPEDGSTDCATDTQFSWTASTDPEGDAFGYYLYLDTIRNTNRTVSPVEGISDTAYTPDGIEQGRTYYWYVMAKDENGAATKTDVRTFTTSSPILKFPSDPTPADAASGVVTSNNLTLQWQQDAAGRQVAYHLYFGKNPRSLSLKAEALDIKQYPFDEYLNGETIYYWQIEAVDQETGETARGALWQFKTAALIPPKQVDAQTNADGSQIELAFDKRMADPVGQECHFTVKRTSENVIASRQLDARASISVETIELKPGDPTKFLLSLDHFIMNGDNVTVSYECGQVQSADKAWLESYQNATVTNRVPGQPPILQGATATSNTLILQFDRMMKEAPSAATKSFIVQSDGKKLQIDSVERQTDETLYRINLKDGYRINYGEEVLLSYNKGDVKAKNEAALETFTAYEVVNTTAPATPVLSGAVTNTKGDKIVLTFDRDMMIEGDQSSCFTVQIVPFPGITARRGITVTQAEVMSDETKIELTLNQRLEYGEIVKVSYVPGTVKSSEGALLNTLTDEAVVNSVPVEPEVARVETDTSGKELTVTFDKTMKTPNTTQTILFNVQIERVEATTGKRTIDNIHIADITLNSDNKAYDLTLDSTINNGDSATLTYFRGGVESADGGWLKDFEKAITNDVTGESPELESATLTANGTEITAAFSMKMAAGINSQKGQFAVRVNGLTNTIQSMTRDADHKIYLIEVADEIVYGERVTLSYTKGSVKAEYGTWLESFSDFTVENEVPPPAPQLQSAYTNAKGNKIVLRFDREMVIEGDQSSRFIPQVSSASGERNGTLVTEATVLTDRHDVELTLNQRVEYAQTVKITYLPGTVKSSEGALLAAILNQPVVNGVSSEPEALTVRTDGTGKYLTVQFDKEMKTPESTQNTAFNVEIERVEAATGKRTVENINITAINLNTDNTEISLTLESTVNNGDSATLTYTRGGVESADGGWLKDFEKAITNDVTGESPELESATLTANGTEITAAFSMKMAAGINSQKGQFAVRVNGLTNTIQSMTRDADHKIYLIEVADEIVYGEQVTLSYTKGTVKAEYGTWLESFTDYVVNNQVAPLPPTVENVYTNTDGDYVYVALDKVLETPLNQQNNFALSMITPVFNRNGLTVENATLSDTDSRIIGLDLSGNMHYGDRYNLTFTPGLIETTEGATLSAFTNEITNNVPAPVPHFVSATLTADMKHVEVGFDQDMQEPSVDEMMQFSAMIEDYPNQITAASLKPGEANIIVLTLEKIVGRGNEVNVSYYKGTVKSSDGGILDTFLNQSADTSLVTDYLVSKGCGWHYSTIQEAVDDPAITDGSKIIVYPGTYREEIEIYDHSLHITSTDPASPAVVQSTVLKIPYEAVNPFDIQYVFDVYTPQTAGTIIEGFTIGNDLSFGVFAEETRVTVRNNVFDGMEEFPAIAVLACASDTVSGSMTEIASNTFRNADFQNGDAMIFVGEGSDAMLYGNLIENNTGSPGNGVWIDNEYADLDGYTTVYNHDGDPWREFFCPHASVEFVEHNSDPSFNNIYRDNGTSEGSNIVFIKQDMLPEQTANGTLETSPATWIAYATFSMTATYTFDGFTSEGSLTLTMDATFNTMSTQSRVKIGDAEERDLLPSEGNGQYINLSGITGEDVVVVFTLNQTVAENMPGTYPFLIEADRDGPDSLYDKSGGVGSAITLLSP
jgi:uncharacterized repeat protein (TIGR02059 family)